MALIQAATNPSGRPLVELGVCVSRLDRQLEPSNIDYSPYPLTALIDTGAGRSQIELGILLSLGLDQNGEIELHTASSGNAPVVMPLLLVDLFVIGERPGPFAVNLEVVGSNRLAGLRVDMLLGRDVLDRCLLFFDGINRRYSIAYNPPLDE